MRRKWYTKALSLVLSASMTMSLIPTTAFASESVSDDLYAELESYLTDAMEDSSETFEESVSLTLEPVLCTEEGEEYSTEDVETADSQMVTDVVGETDLQSGEASDGEAETIPYMWNQWHQAA